MEIFEIFDFSLFWEQISSSSNRGKLIKKGSDDTILGRNLFFDTISPVQPEEISRSAIGAEILKFETTLGPNFKFTLSWARTEGGRMLRRR